MTRKPHLYTILVLAGAALGLFFASFSTADFARHLDRQEHSVSCSFTPGLSKTEAGKSDCKTTMMSEYSSIMRTRVWGGIPISLPAMSVFAFILLFAIEVCLTGRQNDPRATGFLAAATALPAVTSGVMAFISLSKLDAACKLCIGIYMASLLVVMGGVLLWRRAVEERRDQEIDGIATHGTAASGYDARTQQQQPARTEHGDPAFTGSSPAGAVEPEVQRVAPRAPGRVAAGGGLAPTSPTWGYLGAAFALGVVLVVVPVFAYATMAPDHSSFIGTCGELREKADPLGVMVPLDDHTGGAPAIEVFDPLCPACRAFENRLESSGFKGELDRVAVMFPLDSECNWMVTDRTHPGACAVSEAVLCAEARAPEVIAWAFAEQEAIKIAAKASGDAARDMARARFPELAKCIGSPVAQSRLNKSLRWAVRNELSVYTPQLYIDGVKLCDEDTDLGLEYSLGRMLERRRSGTLRAIRPAGAPEPVPLPPEPAAAPPPPVEKPAAEAPPAEKPAAEKPAAEKPAAEKPAAETKPEEPEAEEPAPAEPKPEEPPAEEPAAEEPPAEGDGQ